MDTKEGDQQLRLILQQPAHSKQQCGDDLLGRSSDRAEQQKDQLPEFRSFAMNSPTGQSPSSTTASAAQVQHHSSMEEPPAYRLMSTPGKRSSCSDRISLQITQQPDPSHPVSVKVIVTPAAAPQQLQNHDRAITADSNSCVPADKDSTLCVILQVSVQASAQHPLKVHLHVASRLQPTEKASPFAASAPGPAPGSQAAAKAAVPAATRLIAGGCCAGNSTVELQPSVRDLAPKRRIIPIKDPLTGAEVTPVAHSSNISSSSTGAVLCRAATEPVTQDWAANAQATLAPARGIGQGTLWHPPSAAPPRLGISEPVRKVLVIKTPTGEVVEPPAATPTAASAVVTSPTYRAQAAAAAAAAPLPPAEAIAEPVRKILVIKDPSGKIGQPFPAGAAAAATAGHGHLAKSAGVLEPARKVLVIKDPTGKVVQPPAVATQSSRAAATHGAAPLVHSVPAATAEPVRKVLVIKDPNGNIVLPPAAVERKKAPAAPLQSPSVTESVHKVLVIKDPTGQVVDVSPLPPPPAPAAAAAPAIAAATVHTPALGRRALSAGAKPFTYSGATTAGPPSSRSHSAAAACSSHAAAAAEAADVAAVPEHKPVESEPDRQEGMASTGTAGQESTDHVQLVADSEPELIRDSVSGVRAPEPNPNNMTPPAVMSVHQANSSSAAATVGGGSSSQAADGVNRAVATLLQSRLITPAAPADAAISLQQPSTSNTSPQQQQYASLPAFKPAVPPCELLPEAAAAFEAALPFGMLPGNWRQCSKWGHLELNISFTVGGVDAIMRNRKLYKEAAYRAQEATATAGLPNDAAAEVRPADGCATRQQQQQDQAVQHPAPTTAAGSVAADSSTGNKGTHLVTREVLAAPAVALASSNTCGDSSTNVSGSSRSGSSAVTAPTAAQHAAQTDTAAAADAIPPGSAAWNAALQSLLSRQGCKGKDADVKWRVILQSGDRLGPFNAQQMLAWLLHNKAPKGVSKQQSSEVAAEQGSLQACGVVASDYNAQRLPGAKFYKPLIELVPAVAAGLQYAAVTKADLAKGVPPKSWNVTPEAAAITAAKHADAAATTERSAAAAAKGAVAAAAARSAATAVSAAAATAKSSSKSKPANTPLPGQQHSESKAQNKTNKKQHQQQDVKHSGAGSSSTAATIASHSAAAAAVPGSRAWDAALQALLSRQGCSGKDANVKWRAILSDGDRLGPYSSEQMVAWLLHGKVPKGISKQQLGDVVNNPGSLQLCGILSADYNAQRLPGAKFYKPLSQLVPAVAAGMRYAAVSKADLAKGFPAKDWNSHPAAEAAMTAAAVATTLAATAAVGARAGGSSQDWRSQDVDTAVAASSIRQQRQQQQQRGSTEGLHSSSNSSSSGHTTAATSSGNKQQQQEVYKASASSSMHTPAPAATTAAKGAGTPSDWEDSWTAPVDASAELWLQQSDVQDHSMQHIQQQQQQADEWRDEAGLDVPPLLESHSTGRSSTIWLADAASLSQQQMEQRVQGAVDILKPVLGADYLYSLGEEELAVIARIEQSDLHTLVAASSQAQAIRRVHAFVSEVTQREQQLQVQHATNAAQQQQQLSQPLPDAAAAVLEGDAAGLRHTIRPQDLLPQHAEALAAEFPRYFASGWQQFTHSNLRFTSWEVFESSLTFPEPQADSKQYYRQRRELYQACTALLLAEKAAAAVRPAPGMGAADEHGSELQQLVEAALWAPPPAAARVEMLVVSSEHGSQSGTPTAAAAAQTAAEATAAAGLAPAAAAGAAFHQDSEAKYVCYGKPACAQCGDAGDTLRHCTTPFCQRCDVYGHSQEECHDACERCGRVHNRSDGICRTFHCSSCGLYGHRVQHCPSQVCQACGYKGHSSRRCQAHRNCTLCGERGHQLDTCPLVCSRCNMPGHNVADCMRPWCSCCQQLGHSSAECLYNNSAGFGSSMQPSMHNHNRTPTDDAWNSASSAWEEPASHHHHHPAAVAAAVPSRPLAGSAHAPTHAEAADTAAASTAASAAASASTSASAVLPGSTEWTAALQALLSRQGFRGKDTDVKWRVTLADGDKVGPYSPDEMVAWLVQGAKLPKGISKQQAQATAADAGSLQLCGILSTDYNAQRLPGAKFYKPLSQLVPAVAAGMRYAAVSKADLAQGAPPKGWNGGMRHAAAASEAAPVKAAAAGGPAPPTVSISSPSAAVGVGSPRAQVTPRPEQRHRLARMSSTADARPPRAWERHGTLAKTEEEQLAEAIESSRQEAEARQEMEQWEQQEAQQRQKEQWGAPQFAAKSYAAAAAAAAVAATAAAAPTLPETAAAASTDIAADFWAGQNTHAVAADSAWDDAAARESDSSRSSSSTLALLESVAVGAEVAAAAAAAAGAETSAAAAAAAAAWQVDSPLPPSGMPVAQAALPVLPGRGPDLGWPGFAAASGATASATVLLPAAAVQPGSTGVHPHAALEQYQQQQYLQEQQLLVPMHMPHMGPGIAAPPGYTVAQPPGYSAAPPPAFNQAGLPPGHGPAAMPAGFGPAVLPPHAPGFDPAVLPPHAPGFGPAVLPPHAPGFGPAALPPHAPGFGPAVLPPHTPGFGPAVLPPHALPPSVRPPPGYTTPQGQQPGFVAAAESAAAAVHHSIAPKHGMQDGDDDSELAEMLGLLGV